jgi:hypothetical protein
MKTSMSVNKKNDSKEENNLDFSSFNKNSHNDFKNKLK